MAVAEVSVDAEGWVEEFNAAFARIAGRFARVEPRRQARAFLLGLLSDVDARSCWQLAEQAGDRTPHRMQRLLGEARWDADAVRDDLRGYVVVELGYPDAVLIVDDTGDLKKGLDLPEGRYEVPLILQDRTFDVGGSLFYPSKGVTAYHPRWVPEFFGDTPVVNGKAYPYLAVEPRRYRLRLFNGADSRFFNLWFDHSHRRLPFWLIGHEGGLRAAPPPAPEEMGWKDTFHAHPKMVSRIIATFDLPAPLPAIPGTASRTPAEYVHHCHILEHEDNEMMRPWQVVD